MTVEQPQAQKRKIFTILCIDGGGIRGIVPARILEEIETQTGKPISELFDMVGGPSTGAIVAAGLCVSDPADKTKPKFTAKQMKEFYFNSSPKIFPTKTFKMFRQLAKGGLYDPKPLEDALEAAYGDAKVRDSRTSILIPVTDIKNFTPAWINHIQGKKDESPENWSSMLMRDAVRAATTAPTFFPSKYYMTTPDDNMPNITHRHALIDGGFYSGTILHRLLAEAKRAAPPDADIVMVHVGTGSAENSLSPEEYNKLSPIDLMSQSKGSLLLSLVVSMPVRDAAMSIKDDIGNNFYTFDGKIPLIKTASTPTISMDDASMENMKNLEKFAESIIDENKEAFDQVCNVLKSRDFSMNQFNVSQKAFDQVVEMMKVQPNAKALNKLYQKIQQISAGETIDEPSAEDIALAVLVPQLLPAHMQQLQESHKTMEDSLTANSGLKGAFNKVMGTMRDLSKKVTGSFNQTNNTPPASNDNDKDKKPDSETPAKKPKKPFFRF